MGWLFNLLYAMMAIACAPLIAWRMLRRRMPIAGWREKLSGQVAIRPSNQRRIWLHAVSVGEVNLLAHLLPRLKQKFPGWDYVVSTTTQTGRELADRKFGSENTCFFPFDFTWSVEEALSRIQPNLVVLAELELWPNFLSLTHQRGIPVAVINGRLSDESFRWYRRFRWLLQTSFAKLTGVAAQSREYGQRFIALGIDPSRVAVTGNMKFDGARSDRDNPTTIQFNRLLGRTSDQVIWLAGSTQDPEEQIAVQCYAALRSTFPQLRLIVAPRHPERCDSVIAGIQSLGFVAVRRSKIEQSHPLRGDEVLVIDTVGELAAWWGVSQIAYVGGSMGDRGGQNMIEPSAFGCAVAFGPNTKNFRDVVSLLLTDNAAVVVQNANDLQKFVHRCLQEPAWRDQLGVRAQRLVLAQTGATEQTIDLLGNLVGLPNQSIEKAA